MSDATVSAEVSRPASRAGKFFKWLLIVALLLAIVAVLFWLIWDAGAKRRLEAARQDLRSQGYATTIEEFVDSLELPADSVNAAIELKAAAGMIDLETEAWSAVNGARHLPTLSHEPAIEVDVDYPENFATWEQIERLLAENAAAFEALEGVDAKLRPSVDAVQADFGINWANPPNGLAVNIHLPDLNTQRSLANLHRFAILLRAHRGEHDQLARPLLRMLGIADAVDASHYMLVGHLVAMGIDALAADTIIRITPMLDIGDGAGQKTRNQVEMLIALLLDDAPRRRGWGGAMRGEVLFQQNSIDSMSKGGSINFDGSQSAMSRLTKPIIRDNGTLMAEMMPPLAKAAEAQSWPVARDKIDFDATYGEIETSHRYYLAAILLPTLNRAAAHFRNRTDRRLAATALAIAIYRSDNDGQLPPTLEALVPDYLPAVPRDPMAVDAPLAYDADRALLWSVGTNNLDDGGDASPAPSRDSSDRGTGPHDWASLDVVIPLTPEAVAKLLARDESVPGRSRRRDAFSSSIRPGFASGAVSDDHVPCANSKSSYTAELIAIWRLRWVSSPGKPVVTQQTTSLFTGSAKAQLDWLPLWPNAAGEACGP